MKVWALFNENTGDVECILNCTGYRKVEKKLIDLGRENLKEEIDDFEDTDFVRDGVYKYCMSLLDSGDNPELIDFTPYHFIEFHVDSDYELDLEG